MKTIKSKLFASVFLFTSIAILGSQSVIAETAISAVEKRTQGQLVLENVPQAPQEIKDRLLQYQNVRSAGFIGFSKNGILISTRFGETSQIHAVDKPLGARNQLTYYPDNIGGATMRPKHNSFVFSKDKGGDEFFQIYHFDLNTGKTIQLTEAGTRNEGLNFSKDGKWAAWSVLRSGSAVREIVIMEVDNPQTKKIVFKKEGGWSVLDFSPDGKSLLLGEYKSITQSTRSILNIASGDIVQITPDLKVSYDGGQFSNDGKSVYLITDEGRDFSYGVKVDLKSNTRKQITPKLNWDVVSIVASPDGKNLAYTTNEDGISKFYLSNMVSGAKPKALNLPIGVLGGLEWNDASTQIGFSLSTAKAPSDAFVYNIANGGVTRWTKSEIGGLNAENFVDPKLVHFPSFDEVNGKKRLIPAFVYAPKTKGPHPVIINIHGGPEGQSRPNFSSTINYWVNELNTIVIVPNVRGSTGYGKAYVDLDNGFKREDSVKDIGSLLDWIGTQSNMDKDKIAVYGGSYGGYMVLASMTHYNDRLAGAVDIVGISNFVTFLNNTQGYRRDLRRVEYGDERIKEMYDFQMKISPLSNASKITKPLFVIQGANDPRVPQSEAEQIVAKVRANGTKVWYMLGLDEGHGFAKKTNRDAQREAETLFFKEIFGIK
ncbi:MAG: S9 family peptidase [Caulobacterales bacterium]|nr:S9 family peptidase [Caulobacterales bacterium]